MAIINNSLYRASEGINQSYLKYIGEPSVFKAKINAVREEKVHFTLGTFLDDILYDYSLLESKYLVTDEVKITEGVKIVVDKLFSKVSSSGVNISNDISQYKDSMRSASIDSEKFTSLKEETLIEKLKKEGDEYWKFLCKKISKLVINNAEYSIMMHNYNQLSPILNNIDYPIEIRAKICLNGIIQDVLCKAELDYLIINHSKKTWKVTDLKSTENVLGFRKSIFEYRYDFQNSFYEQLVEVNLKELGLEGYTKVQSEWLIASNAYKMPIRLLRNKVDANYSYTYLGRTYIGVIDALNAYKWHLENDKWDYPKTVYINGFELFNPEVTYNSPLN